MSGFSSTWLDLREPADHAARNREITAAAAALFAGRETMSIVDLGCGTGSTVRALAPFLAADQHWRLVDHDADLLGTATETLAGWADVVIERSPLVLAHAGKRLTVVTERHDLARTPPDFTGEAGSGSDRADLVTASALLDLVSAEWVRALARSVAAAKAVFLAALTYDGEAEWEPSHPLDDVLCAALDAHQRTDKGFGPALGPDAGGVAAEVFSDAGYAVKQGRSAWELGPESATLRGALAEGYVAAARAMDAADAAGREEWLAFRKATGTAARIGHVDLLAWPAPAR